MKNAPSALRIKLTPLKEELHNVTLMISYKDSDGHKNFQQIPVEHSLVPDKAVPITWDYIPREITGQVTLDFYVGCYLTHEVNFYRFSTTLPVFDPSGSRDDFRKVIMNFNASDVADFNFYGDVKKELDSLAGKTPNDLIAELHAKPACFVKQDLRRISHDPNITKLIEDSGIYPEITDKLLLKWKDFKIFLLAAKDIKVGRAAELCDLVVRKKGVPVDVKPNRTVSRVHGIVHYLGDHVAFEDKSSYGSWINNQRVEKKMTFPAAGKIEFGDIHWKMNLQYCNGASLHPMCGFCPRKKIKSLTFTRCDGDKELYFFIWQGCDLGKVIPELAGWKVYHRDNTFIISDPNDKIDFLRPGVTLDRKGQKIEVNFFSQL
ncbi:MAG: FHA domain-containing protein [Lentisphaeria bacterium]|nr:FHA domain-containing protein [Lentisphaeria bacterium]